MQESSEKMEQLHTAYPKMGKRCQMMEQEIQNLSKDKQELQENFSEKSRQKRKLDEMYDQLRSEYESVKRSAIQPANNFFSRGGDSDLFASPANMMDNRDSMRKGFPDSSVATGTGFILRLVFATVYLSLNKGGNDNDVSSASRLLSLRTHFSTKMIRRYGSLQHIKNGSITDMEDSLPLLLADKERSETENSKKLEEMAHLLEIIRNVQRRLATKFKKICYTNGGQFEAIGIYGS
ncbi:unnamed protein product [Lactuca virosa]|uniref:Uncharacterized protein n=1 Tax=Lactuca virosa TaxID=75947 RepID=A0AAU9PVZ9_9ASTR|nr:unnamed protein product [Lactuca virosa]